MQKWTTRRLRKLSSNRIPSDWIFIDTETLPENDLPDALHYFRLGWGCYSYLNSDDQLTEGEWQYFTDAESLSRWIDIYALRVKNLMLIGHNIFFDLQASGFFDYFSLWGWKIDFYYDSHLTYILRVRKSGAIITICSSTNWFTSSLRELGEVVGKQKGEVDFRTASTDELKEYCRLDVEIVIEALRLYIRFIRDHKLGRFALTKSSQSLVAFRTRFMMHPVYLHDNLDARDLERGAYMGGRTEAFFIGDVPGEGFVSLDVNSMYPYVMKRFRYPYKLVDYSENLSIERLQDILQTHAVILEGEVETPEPIFAVRMKDKTIFPTGRFDCYLCSEGVRYALDKGYLRRVYRAAIYQCADLFSLYVDYFHAIRLEYQKQDNESMQLFCKYLHNSLYGKFGQRGLTTEIRHVDKWTGRMRMEIIDTTTRGYVIQTYLLNSLVIQFTQGECRDSFPAIAAHITENARLVLWNIINRIGRDTVLYCDTDSVKIRKKDMHLLSGMIDRVEMGKLKIEDESERLTILGAKAYETERSRAIKGIPLSAVEVAPGLFQFESFPGQATHLREGITRGTKIITITRRLESTYDKGVVLPNGHIEPFRLGELWQQIDESEIPF